MDLIRNSLEVILFTTGVFVAIILSLAVPPKIVKRLLGKIVLFLAIGALVLYGYGYANQTESPMVPYVAVIRATLDVLLVFVGSNNWDAVKSAYPLGYQQACFWLLHLIAVITSASAVISILGSNLIRKLRLWLLRRRDIGLIYGLNENTLEFGKMLISDRSQSVLYVDSDPENALATAVTQMGGVLRTDPDALEANVRFLKSMGLRGGKRKLHLYALSVNLASNRQYVARILPSLEKRTIRPDQISLTLLGADDDAVTPFLKTKQCYGFGSVLSVNEPELAARMLVKAYPPSDVIAFDDAGKAKNDFHGVIIGFGYIGQAVLKQLVANGQFYGSQFHLAVFAPDCQEKMGRLAQECSEMLRQYDISFHPHDGRSIQTYEYLANHCDSLNYIAVCAGSHGTNLEIAEQLYGFLKRKNCPAPIYMCSNQGICSYAGSQDGSNQLYVPELLCSDQIDLPAMVINHRYSSGAGDMKKNWEECGVYNRMSSRASADFRYAFLRAAGTTAEEAKENWAPAGELLENLAKTEHLRWNAFHYTMGFRCMTPEEFSARAAAFQEEKAKDPGYRITRDMDRRIHACLIPWEELDAYSQKENAITGGNRNYKQNDRDNVLAIGEILRKTESPKTSD